MCLLCITLNNCPFLDCACSFKDSVLQNVQKKIALANWSPHMSLSASLCKNGNLVAQVHVQNSVDIWKVWNSVFLLKYLYIPEWGSWLELLSRETATSALSTRSLYCQGTMGSLVSQGWLFLSSRERWAFKHIPVRQTTRTKKCTQAVE